MIDYQRRKITGEKGSSMKFETHVFTIEIDCFNNSYNISFAKIMKGKNHQTKYLERNQLFYMISKRTFIHYQ